MKKIIDDKGMSSSDDQNPHTTKRKLKICLIGGDRFKLENYAISLIKLGHIVDIKTNKSDLTTGYDVIQLHDKNQIDELNKFIFSLDDDPVLSKEEYDECFKKSDLILVYDQIKPNHYGLGYKTFNLKPYGEESVSAMMLRLEEIYYYYLNIPMYKMI